LPAAADNQAQLQIRVITTNASGNDEWVGIDDISITGTPLPTDTAPSVTSTTPANGATSVAVGSNIINFSESVNATTSSFTVDCGGAQTYALSASPSADDLRFIDTKSRPALAQTFTEVGTGYRFTAAVNHFKSKGSACTDVGDPDAGDGQGNCNGTRTDAALALVDWPATDPTGSGDPDFLIMGDLNSYAKEDPIDEVGNVDPTPANYAWEVVPTCNGFTMATIYVQSTGIVRGGPNDGMPYTGTLNGTESADVMFATSLSETINGFGGGDTFNGEGGDDTLQGIEGDDTLNGGAGTDTLEGGLGIDTLEGGGNDDTLRGRIGNDQLFGEGGNDRLTGNQGADAFSGGAGTDVATDFNAGQGDTSDGTIP
jgi:Ca2+-binding RTX toxin-like protein